MKRFYVDVNGNYLDGYDDADRGRPEEFANAVEVTTAQRFYVDANGNYLGSFDGLDEEMPVDFQIGIEVPTAPLDGRQIWNGQKWLEAAPAAELLTAELDRRLSSGFDWTFEDERGTHHFGTAPSDMNRWTQEVTPLAQAAMNMGEPNRKIGIKTDTGPTFVTASEWWRVLDAAAAWRQPLFASYFALKALPQIPEDYATNPSYWP